MFNYINVMETFIDKQNSYTSCGYIPILINALTDMISLVKCYQVCKYRKYWYVYNEAAMSLLND